MNEDLRETLRSVIKEELKDIRTELHGVNARMVRLEEKQDKQFNKIERELIGHNEWFDTIDLKLEKHDERFDKLGLGQEKILSELRSSNKHLEETVKQHNFIIDLLQKEVKPDYDIRYKKE
ncbi:hypothetical protein [Neobacillus ginsengisoli]|uniref:DUF5082 domain-containing protein n=1 Tax=Neobacillus ginsengisoli TaxID=904295 RepID=A0ABT9Y0Z3_9BACI|nr:hypothetical protein [Neobacillus ginsengisoli]MDQ0200804.1 hypothetical protein [Neobacillus ginsengisoli]